LITTVYARAECAQSTVEKKSKIKNIYIFFNSAENIKRNFKKEINLVKKLSLVKITKGTG